MRCWLGKSLAGAALALAAGALALPTPASADVTVDPDVSVQGGAPRLTFTVTNGSPKATLDEVVLTMPDSMPIAETYPLSIDDWAPRISWKKLDTPLQGVHSSKVTEAVSDITWFAMPGKGAKPGQSAELLVTLGPLPVAEQVVFTVTEKYDDGTTVVNDVVPAAGASAPNAAAVLRLIPDTISDSNGGHHGGGTATETQNVASVTDTGSNAGLWVGIAGLLVGLAGGGAIMWFIARRKPATAPATAGSADAGSTTAGAGSATAGAGSAGAGSAAAGSDASEKPAQPDSVWRYRGDSPTPEAETSAGEAAPTIRAAAGKTS
ncbi:MULTISPECIES: DUF1775 domain-containing protein [Catenuloplanes]|uniref:Uncharacterized protein YcnI n=1 Tax=Catenuloplanes niger TaxID=587534 RepID=A0AAE4CTC0_9ACTN|nr:DUF1775 domain-containing protein [Catenuloplanes niger]MDR7323262.1 uncharacterized protein YcnI [Catenuloplanes niger]